jgi:putative FmdB family regulatory protein
MAAYDYRCRTCTSVFEVHRPVTAAADPAGLRCPAGHADVTRVWSAVAFATGTTAGALSSPAPPAAAPAGGCCGGGCCG